MTAQPADGSPSIWRRSWLHPEALYLRQDTPAGAPPPDPSLLDGVRRLRAVLPAGVEPPPGWTHVKSTLLRRIDAARLQAALPPPPPGVRVGLLARGGHDWSRWIALHACRYRATHRDNPPRGLLARERAEVFAGDDMLSALGLWHAGRLQGFASLRRAGPGGAEVGWIGATGRDPTRACAWLLGRCAKEARRRNLRWLEVEIDSNDAQLAPLLRQLPPGEDQAFRTWEMRVRP